MVCEFKPRAWQCSDPRGISVKNQWAVTLVWYFYAPSQQVQILISWTVISWAVFSSPLSLNTIHMVMITHFISSLTSPIIINWPIKLTASKIEMLIFISTPPHSHKPVLLYFLALSKWKLHDFGSSSKKQTSSNNTTTKAELHLDFFLSLTIVSNHSTNIFHSTIKI